MTAYGETQRLAALHDLHILDTPPERRYDDITRLAAYACGTPIALISLIDGDRQWFKSRVGLDQAQTPRAYAFCAHAIRKPLDTMVVPDTLDDERFALNPLVTGQPHVRFYAGAPLLTQEGHALGTLCVIDTQPRRLSDQQLDALHFLAGKVVERMEAQRARRR